MATKVKIPDLDALHKPFADARKRRDSLAKETGRLRREADAAIAGGRGLPDGVAARSIEISRQRVGADADVRIERQQARSLAQQQLQADPRFRDLVKATVEALAARLAGLAAYQGVAGECGERGIKVPSLPDGPRQELAASRAWAAYWVRVRVLEPGDVPGSLRLASEAGR